MKNEILTEEKLHSKQARIVRTTDSNVLMTVKELIDKLSQYPDDMIVGTDFQPEWGIVPKVRTWTHSNYPYDKEDFDYLNLE